jgi:hypothetical protein
MSDLLIRVGTCAKHIHTGQFVGVRARQCGPAEEGDRLAGVALEEFGEGDDVYYSPLRQALVKRPTNPLP